MGHAIIHGRKSYESWQTLPGRRNTSSPAKAITKPRLRGCSLNDAIKLARSSDECPWICGGEALSRSPAAGHGLRTHRNPSTIEQADTFFLKLMNNYFKK